MSLPSLDDIVFIIVLLIPGFFTLTLFRWIAILEKKLSEYQLIIWSVFASLFIYSIFGWYTGVTDFELVKDRILLPENLAGILGLSLVLGVIPGLIIRVMFRRHFVRGDSWNACMTAASREGSWVTVYTSDGHEYKGILHYSGAEESSKDISIREPKLILRDSKWNLVEEVEVGHEILFSEKDIVRIVFFKEV